MTVVQYFQSRVSIFWSEFFRVEYRTGCNCFAKSRGKELCDACRGDDPEEYKYFLSGHCPGSFRAASIKGRQPQLHDLLYCCAAGVLYGQLVGSLVRLVFRTAELAGLAA